MNCKPLKNCFPENNCIPIIISILLQKSLVNKSDFKIRTFQDSNRGRHDQNAKY